MAHLVTQAPSPKQRVVIRLWPPKPPANNGSARIEIKARAGGGGVEGLDMAVQCSSGEQKRIHLQKERTRTIQKKRREGKKIKKMYRYIYTVYPKNTNKIKK